TYQESLRIYGSCDRVEQTQFCVEPACQLGGLLRGWEISRSGLPYGYQDAANGVCHGDAPQLDPCCRSCGGYVGGTMRACRRSLRKLPRASPAEARCQGVSDSAAPPQAKWRWAGSRRISRVLRSASTLR